MTYRRILNSPHFRRFSTGPRRPRSSSEPFVSHLEAATTRYRQGKKVKDINKSEWTLQREKNVSRKNDRGVGRATPPTATERHGIKRPATYATTSATDLYRNKKSGLAAACAAAPSSRSNSKKATVQDTSSAPKVVSATSKSSKLPYAALIGAVGVVFAANSPEFQEHPTLSQVKLAQNELIKMLGLEATFGISVEIPPEPEKETKRRKGWLFWRKNE